ncbi:MAG: hypothetical protein JNN30_19540 [Rhodanobacteraceae bacterium]|nr:hypothetical protein [Rhodanobacteraceae bacterium]
MPTARTAAPTSLAAALLGHAPLLLAATDLRSGLALGCGSLLALAMLATTLSLTRVRAPRALSITLCSSVAAAVSTWFVAAWITPAADIRSVLPLAAANAACWQQAARGKAALGLATTLVFAPVLVGALRSATGAAQHGLAYAPLGELLAWLTSAGGLLLLAAITAAVFQTFAQRSNPFPAQDPPRR